MKYLIIINDGKNAFHLGQNNSISVTTKGIYYTAISIPRGEQATLLPLTEFLNEANISRKEFDSTVKELQEIKLAAVEENSPHTYITISNTEILRKEYQLEVDTYTSSILFNMAEFIAKNFCKYFNRHYSEKYAYSWFSILKDMYKKEIAPLDQLAEMVKWYCKHQGGKYIPTIGSPTEFKNKWNNLLQAQKREGVEKKKGMAYL